VAAQLWVRLPVADGIELSFDARRFGPAAGDLARLRSQIRAGFGIQRPSAAPEHDSKHPTGGLDEGN
jgi:hypothetical protein